MERVKTKEDSRSLQQSNTPKEVNAMKEKSLEGLVGKDRLKGRPIRLNTQRLDINHDNYAEFIAFGDIHYGHPACDVDKVKRQADYCLKKHIYVLGMGDYIEAGLRGSVGDSVYEQVFNPQKQMDFIVDLFQPLADAGLILGLLNGNHEGRIKKETSVDIGRLISKMLRVPFLGYACWNLFYVGKQSYTIYSLHGSSGSRYVYTKLKALVDISHNFNADLLLMGHVHECADDVILVQEVDRKRKMVVEKKKALILTGSYLQYDDSYAQEKGYPMGKLGSPKIKLFSDSHHIHTSW